jgi:fibrillarin-like pre-rRNA processing protein
MKIQPHKFKGVYVLKKGKNREIFLTKSLVKGKKVYGEHLYTEGKDEYREWDPERSKLGAALAKKVSQLGIYPGSKVLYLGACTGTTASHVSDIVGKEGFVYALDFAPRTTRNLVYLCEERKNMTPIIADANQTRTFAHCVSLVDCVFQDIAQRHQAEIFIKNCERFLRPGGFGVLAVKARSVDVASKPTQIFKEAREFLEKNITIVDYRELDPIEKDHCIFICKKQ